MSACWTSALSLQPSLVLSRLMEAACRVVKSSLGAGKQLLIKMGSSVADRWQAGRR